MTEKKRVGRWTLGLSSNPRGKTPGSGELQKLRASIADDVPEILAALVTAAKSVETQAAQLIPAPAAMLRTQIDPCQDDGYWVNEKVRTGLVRSEVRATSLIHCEPVRSWSAPVDHSATNWFAAGSHGKAPTDESANPFKNRVRARSPPPHHRPHIANQTI